MSNSLSFENFSYESIYKIDKDFLDKSTSLICRVCEVLSFKENNYIVRPHHEIKVRDFGRKCQKLSYKILCNNIPFLTLSFWLSKENGTITYDCELIDKNNFPFFKIIKSEKFENIYNFLIPYVFENIE